MGPTGSGKSTVRSLLRIFPDRLQWIVKEAHYEPPPGPAVIFAVHQSRQRGQPWRRQWVKTLYRHRTTRGCLLSGWPPYHLDRYAGIRQHRARRDRYSQYDRRFSCNQVSGAQRVLRAKTLFLRKISHRHCILPCIDTNKAARSQVSSTSTGSPTPGWVGFL